MVVELPFVFERDRVFLDPQHGTHNELLSSLIAAGARSHDERVGQVAEWVRRAHPRLGVVAIEDGSVSDFILSQHHVSSVMKWQMWQ